MNALTLLVILLSIYLLFTAWMAKNQGVFTGKGLFSFQQQSPWWISALSLMALTISLDQIQVSVELIQTHGPLGLWIFWISLTTVFVVPIAFGPVWSKLGYPTDNHLLLIRYEGLGARMLFWFRSSYIGLLIVPIFIAFHGIAAQQMLASVFDLSLFASLAGVASMLLFITWKNNMRIKLPMDGWYAVVFTVALAYLFFHLWLDDPSALRVQQSDLLPWTGDTNQLHFMMTIFFVQWWSASLFDGSGPEMARYTSVSERSRIWLTGVLPAVHRVLIFAVLSMIALMIAHRCEQNGTGIYQELLSGQGELGKAILLFIFLIMFVGQSESLMNWGGGLLVEAYDRTTHETNSKAQHTWRTGFVAMLLISCSALAIMFSFKRIEHLLGYFLSISAGVAPVFILRWIWNRISAWSQLTAMLGSAAFTITYPIVDPYLRVLGAFRYDDRRLIFVTFATTASWIFITWIAPHKTQNALLSATERKQLLHRIAWSLALGVCLNILIMLGIWLWT